jgi:hypothetical protein
MVAASAGERFAVPSSRMATADCRGLPWPQPVLTTSLAAVYLGQRLSGRDLGAVGAILAGVMLVIYSKVSEDARRCVRQACGSQRACNGRSTHHVGAEQTLLRNIVRACMLLGGELTTRM